MTTTSQLIANAKLANEIKRRILENKIRELENLTMAVRAQDEYLTGSQIKVDENGLIILPEDKRDAMSGL